MKKRVLTILMTFLLLLSFAPTLDKTGTVYARSSIKASEVVSYMNGQVGQPNNYVRWCLSYVCQIWVNMGFPNSTGWGNATNFANANRISTSRNNIPVGADVFFTSPDGNGHIGIYIGGGYFVHAGGQSVIEKSNLSEAYYSSRYTGWGWHPGVTVIDDSTSHNPTMNVDVTEGRCGAVFVRGWAFDPDDTSKQIEVHVYVGGEAGQGGEGHAIFANTERPDVNNVYGCGNNHGFNAEIRTQKTGTQDVYVYAINIGTGAHSLIVKKGIKISNPNPTGTLDSAEGKCGAVFVRGWAFDPNNTSKPTEIHVYIGAPAGANGTEGHSGVIANTKRPDVNNVYKCGDYHGFSATIPTNKTGKQTVYVYGINIGNGWDNPCIGSKTVTIKSHTLVRTPAKAATTSAEGNIEYWTCSSCGKAFKDSAGKTEVSKADTVIPKLTTSKPSASPESLSVKVDLPTVKITKPKAAKKSVTVKWKKVSKKKQKKIAKIQIQYSRDKKFKKDVKKKLVSVKMTSYKITGLKSKKKYYVRVRAYTKTGTTKHVSKWSAVKVVNVK